MDSNNPTTILPERMSKEPDTIPIFTLMHVYINRYLYIYMVIKIRINGYIYMCIRYIHMYMILPERKTKEPDTIPVVTLMHVYKNTCLYIHDYENMN
jgi:hypothetical protein